MGSHFIGGFKTLGQGFKVPEQKEKQVAQRPVMEIKFLKQRSLSGVRWPGSLSSLYLPLYLYDCNMFICDSPL